VASSWFFILQLSQRCTVQQASYTVYVATDEGSLMWRY